MSALTSYFEQELDAIDAFLLDPEHPVMRIVADREMQRLPLQYLMRREDDERFPHLCVALTQPFLSWSQWFGAALSSLDAELRKVAEAGEPLLIAAKSSTDAGRSLPQEFLARGEGLASALPDQVGSLLFVLVPEQVEDGEGWIRSVRFLADGVTSRWLKFLIVEERQQPLTQVLADHPRILSRVFWLSPEEIAGRAEGDLNHPDPEIRRRGQVTVGLMAFGLKDYDKAEKAQRIALDQAVGTRDALEIALALYNLGNTLLAAERHEEAVGTFAHAADGCIHHKLDRLAPMVYTNLGVALYRAEDVQQALASLKVARDMFHAQRNVPAEAHVYDTLAMLYHADERRDEAERAWRCALALYEGITNPAMGKVREAGRQDILGKLDRFGHGPAPG